MHDIVFISYEETNAEDNWQLLKRRFPSAKRLHGVPGIHMAHITAAQMVSTDLFYVVDGDAKIVDDFNFDYQVQDNQHDHVHVFRAHNPINDLVYGYGAVKLLPTADVRRLADKDFRPDMTSSINRKYKVVHRLSNVTAFNTDPYNTWRSAFRECAKLSSGVIDGQINTETHQRLDAWCTLGQAQPYGHWCLLGAQAGRTFGLASRGTDQLMKINDWSWLREQYQRNGLT
jgi:hypothetical protein